MLRTLAPTATSPSGNPIHGPTPELMPTNGARNGKMTYARAQRTPEITIEVLNTRVSIWFAEEVTVLFIGGLDLAG